MTIKEVAPPQPEKPFFTPGELTGLLVKIKVPERPQDLTAACSEINETLSRFLENHFWNQYLTSPSKSKEAMEALQKKADALLESINGALMPGMPISIDEQMATHDLRNRLAYSAAKVGGWEGTLGAHRTLGIDRLDLALTGVSLISKWAGDGAARASARVKPEAKNRNKGDWAKRELIADLAAFWGHYIGRKAAGTIGIDKGGNEVPGPFIRFVLAVRDKILSSDAQLLAADEHIQAELKKLTPQAIDGYLGRIGEQ